MIVDVASVPHKLYLDSLTRLVVMPVAIRCQKKKKINRTANVPLLSPLLLSNSLLAVFFSRGSRQMLKAPLQLRGSMMMGRNVDVSASMFPASTGLRRVPAGTCGVASAAWTQPAEMMMTMMLMMRTRSFMTVAVCAFRALFCVVCLPRRARGPVVPLSSLLCPSVCLCVSHTTLCVCVCVCVCMCVCMCVCVLCVHGVCVFLF